MLNQSYSIERFLNKLSKTTSAKEVTDLINSTKNILQVEVKSLPLEFSWDAGLDQITGSAQVSLYPKLRINGELYQASSWHKLTIPLNGFAGLEHAFLTALKSSINTVQRIY